MADGVAIHAGLFALDGDELRLLGGYSPSSGRYHFPAAPACPYTGAADVEVVELPAKGTLWAWTAVTVPPAGYAGPVPYGFGIVDLGPLRVVGRLTEPDPSRLEQGQPMTVVPEGVPDATGAPTVTWAFAPSREPGAG